MAFPMGQSLLEIVGSGLSPHMEDRHFMLLRNILSLKGRLASIGTVVDGACPHCGGHEDMAHIFRCCPRVFDLGDGPYCSWCRTFPLIGSF